MGETVEQRVTDVLNVIGEAAARAGRDAGEVTVVAVSKRHPAEAVIAAREAGLRVFGENKVQEAEDKIPDVAGVRWHLVGHLQRNKAKRAVELFELIHSLDSVRLANALDRLGQERGAPVEALVEINAAEEPSKHGFHWDELDEVIPELAGRSGLAIRGLMTMPPLFDDPEQSRPYFQRLRGAAERIAERGLAGVSMDHLSMGMTNDYPVAVEEGATLVRVGTAIFGPRPGH
jgi:hypothetical protein